MLYSSQMLCKVLFSCLAMIFAAGCAISPAGDSPGLPSIMPVSHSSSGGAVITEAPGPLQTCPAEDASLVPDFTYDREKERGLFGIPNPDEFLSYLRAGGAIHKINAGEILDLTGDGQPDLLFHGSTDGNVHIYVLGCLDGQYAMLHDEPPGYQNPPYLEQIIDLNDNGTPEILLMFAERHCFQALKILEWDGAKFASLIQIPVEYNDQVTLDDTLGAFGLSYEFIDTNSDGAQEIMVRNAHCGDLFSSATPLPPGEEDITTLTWDGRNYVITK